MVYLGSKRNWDLKPWPNSVISPNDPMSDVAKDGIQTWCFHESEAEWGANRGRCVATVVQDVVVFVTNE